MDFKQNSKQSFKWYSDMAKLMKEKNSQQNIRNTGPKYSINRSPVFPVLYLVGQNLI